MSRSRALIAAALLVAPVVMVWSWRARSAPTESARDAGSASASARATPRLATAHAELVDEGDPVETARIAEIEDGAPTPATAQPERAAKTARVSGRVLDLHGEPIADALACAISGQQPARDLALDPSNRPWLERVIERKAHSNLEGHFELELSGKRDGVLIVLDAFHSIELRVLAPEDFEQRASGEAVHALGEVVLVPACVLTGRVVDGAGRGVSDARVRAKTTSVPRPETRTRPDGSYRLEHVPVGPVSVEASKAGLHDGGETVQGSEAGATLALSDIVLGTSHSIAGVAVDAEGNALAGVQLEAVPMGGGRMLQATTDANGRFEFELGKAVAHELRAEDHDVLPLRDPLDVLEPGAADARLVLRPHARTQFTVLDALTDAPIEAFTLGVGGSPSSQSSDGRLYLRHAGHFDASSPCVFPAEPKTHWVYCDAPGYESHESRVAHEDRIAHQTLRLHRAAGLRGRVTSGAGATVHLDRQPMRRAGAPEGISESDVWFSFSHDYDLSAHLGRLRSVTCAADGSFAFSELNAGTYRLRVKSPDGANASVENLRIERSAHVDIGDIALSSASSIAGAVIAADGQRLAGLRVELRGAQELAQRLAADGRFDFPGLAPGTYELVVPNRSRICFDVPSVQLELAQGERRELLIDISAHRPAELCVTVSDSAGAAAGLQLHWTQRDGRERGLLGKTGATGRVCGDLPASLSLRLTVATMQGLELAQHELVEVIPAGGRGSAEIELECGALSVEIDEGVELGPKPWYFVRISREPTEPGAARDQQIAWSSSGAERRFELPRAPVGTWRLEAVSWRAKEGQSLPVLAAGEVVIEAGGSAHCVLRAVR